MEDAIEKIINGQQINPEVATIVIKCNIRTGAMSVAGTLENTELCVKMCIEGGHMIMDRNAKLEESARLKNIPPANGIPA